MPNWVTNDLRIYGPKNEIEGFLYHVKTEDSDFDFSMIIPRKTAWEPWQVNSPEELRRLIPAMRNAARESPWGTDRLSRPQDLHIEKIKEPKEGALTDEHSIKISFDTAWFPPLPVIKEASKQFPDLLFYLDFEEEAGQSGGLYRARSAWDAYADTSKIARWEFEHGTKWKFEHGRVIRPFDMKRPEIE